MTIPETTWVGHLERMGVAVRSHLRQVMRSNGAELSRVVAQEGGDTIFALDRHVESVIEDQVASWPDTCKPLLLIAEGLGPDGRKPFGSPAEPLRYRVIVDPIDGTRCLMYDKRSAWFVAAVAADRGETTTLADTIASVLVELPISKQAWGDTFVALRGQAAQGWRTHLETSAVRPLVIRPSTAHTLLNGFGQVSSFFPGTKICAAQLMERIVAVTLGAGEPDQAAVFDDQYLSTAGQMVELMTGHDRFCCDLRPLFFRLLSRQTAGSVSGLTCHPYDIAGALVAQQAGVILTDAFGRPLRPPLDVHHGVHWCGYANAALRARIEPVVQGWLRENHLYPD